MGVDPPTLSLDVPEGATISSFWWLLHCAVHWWVCLRYHRVINSERINQANFFTFGHKLCPLDASFLKNMARLPESHPSVHKAFMEMKFVIQRSDKKSSLMWLDQLQKHNIKFLKKDGEENGLCGQHDYWWPVPSCQGSICSCFRYGSSDTHHQTRLWRVHTMTQMQLLSCLQSNMTQFLRPACFISTCQPSSAHCSIYLETVPIEKPQNPKSKWKGLGLEHQNQGFGAILDRMSARHARCYYMWLCGYL